MTLSSGQIDTLRNLAGRKAGDDVGWVKIAPARELTDLGLAARSRSGWRITIAGEAALGRAGGTIRAACATLPFRPRDLPTGP